MKDNELFFIGKVESTLTLRDDCPFQEDENAPSANLRIHPQYHEAIKNIRKGDRIVVLTWLDRGDRSIVKCVTRNDFDKPEVGVFSTRSPDRPNPIGLHEVTVEDVTTDSIKVSCLEVLNETPILDIKPWLPSF